MTTAAEPITVTTPIPAPAPAPPAPVPAPTPASVAPAVDMAEHLKLVKQVSEMEKDLHKTKAASKTKDEQLGAAKQALIAAGFVPADGNPDPNAILERQRAEAQAARDAAIATERASSKIETAFLRGLISEGVSASERSAKAALNIAREEGLITIDENGAVIGTKEAIAALVKDGILGAKGAPAPSPSPQPARPAAAAAPIDQKFASVVDFKSLVGLGYKLTQEFQGLYPDRYRQLEVEHTEGLLKPRVRIRTDSPVKMV